LLEKVLHGSDEGRLPGPVARKSPSWP